MYRTVTRLLGFSRPDHEVDGTVVRTSGVSVVDRTAVRRPTVDTPQLDVTVRLRNDGPVPRTVPVRVTFHESRWLGLRETALAPVERATDRLAPGETGTVVVRWSDASSVTQYELEAGSLRE